MYIEVMLLFFSIMYVSNIIRVKFLLRTIFIMLRFIQFSEHDNKKNIILKIITKWYAHQAITHNVSFTLHSET